MHWHLWLHDIEKLKLVVSAITPVVAIAGGIVAYLSYLRNEKWKKAEFLADEMKGFLANPQVQLAKILIDWGARRVKLRPSDLDETTVTRSIQVNALRPHTIVGDGIVTPRFVLPQYKAELQRFEDDEVAIRDCYDCFLDGLEAFWSYYKTDLIDLKALIPYLGYWIGEIQSPTTLPSDAEWQAALLTYISFYGFDGTVSLFKELGYDISPSGDRYRGFLEIMVDQSYAAILASTVGVEYCSPTAK
jgi:hypothetical protein